MRRFKAFKAVSLRKQFFILLLALFILKLSGLWMYLFEINFQDGFHYPYDGDLLSLVAKLQMGEEPNRKPINEYNYSFLHNPSNKCESNEPIRFVYVVKSTVDSFGQREAIRNTWGYEKRFSDVTIKTIFVLGTRHDLNVQAKVNAEAAKHNDILQGDFADAYFNNTIKSMLSFKWLRKYCNSVKFYAFIDEDYYVSTKNVLRFIRNPTHYPDYLIDGVKDNHFELPDDVKLFAGNVLRTRPIRFALSKWYITLDEYEYDRWPPYVTGGAYILSKEALIDLYSASFYTKHFRFDDIYVGILAYKVQMEPLHSTYFPAFNEYEDLKFVVAAHGFHDPNLLVRVWNEQKSAGNA